MRLQYLTQFEKSTHDRDVYLDRSVAFENARQHSDSVVGKDERQVTAAAPT